MMFCIGMRVIATSPFEGNRRIVGKTGTIMLLNNKYSNGTKRWGVKFDEDIGGHGLCGNCKYGYGWEVNDTHLKPLNLNKRILE